MIFTFLHLRRQQGVILLAFFAILLIAGAGALIAVLDRNAVSQRRNSNTMVALREAKDQLVAYATLYAEYYSATNSGPGYLPCPDTDGSGVENEPCGVNSLGRLPTAIVLPSGNNFPLSDFNAGLGEQFWYSVADSFRRNPEGVINSATISATTLDGRGRIAAVLIAPGPANSSQSRPSNSSNSYLEDSNTSAPSFLTTTAVDPALFNDRVLAITIDEIMGPVTRQVADLLKTELDAFHVANSRYPVDQAEFVLNIAPASSWFVANAWLSNSNYTRVSDDQATLTFTGCLNISYSVLYAPPDTPDDLRRIGLRC